VAVPGNGTEHTEKMARGQNSKKAEPNERRSLESTAREIGIGRVDDLIKTGYVLMEL
jgi:hypothetical protein